MQGLIQNNTLKKRLFAITLLICMACSMVSWVFTDSETFTSAFFYDKTDTYMDFYNCLYYARDVFEQGMPSIYPPLAHVIFYTVYRMLPADLAAEGAHAVRDSQFGMTFMMLFSQGLCAVLCAIVFLVIRGDYGTRSLLAVALALSAPWVFLLERGNLVALTWVFISLYLLWYDSDNRFCRELGLVSLAIAAGLKMYPAILGLMLIHDRRWKEAIRCVIYGVLAFFLPMLLTPVGFGYISNMMLRYGETSANLTNAGFSTKVNFNNVIRLTFAFGGKYGDTVASAASVLTWCLIILGILCFFLANKKWQAMVLLIIPMYSIPAFASRYVIVYLIVPLLLFLEDEQLRKIDWVYLLLFFGCFAMLTIGSANFFPDLLTARPVSFITALEAFSSFLLFLLVSLDVFYSCLKSSLKKRCGLTET